jgi:hypothetical protein
MPIVTNPANGTNTNNPTNFSWNMQGIYYTSSKVIVGYSPGAEDIYSGTEITQPTCTENGVMLPGGNTLCYARPKYRKQPGGAWYTTYSTITSFTSV